MVKYIYALSAIFIFLTFMAGWNHYIDNGLQAFNIGMMGLTPLVASANTVLWLVRRSDDEF